MAVIREGSEHRRPREACSMSYYRRLTGSSGFCKATDTLCGREIFFSPSTFASLVWIGLQSQREQRWCIHTYTYIYTRCITTSTVLSVLMHVDRSRYMPRTPRGVLQQSHYVWEYVPCMYYISHYVMAAAYLYLEYTMLGVVMRRNAAR